MFHARPWHPLDGPHRKLRTTMFAARPWTTSSQAAKDSVINEMQAIEIFLAKASRKARDTTSRMLAEEYGITMKAVRDIWNFRTWKWETMPYWSQEDLRQFLSRHLCTDCRLQGARSLEEACKSCAFPRRRGRPVVNKATQLDLHSDTVLSLSRRSSTSAGKGMAADEDMRHGQAINFSSASPAKEGHNYEEDLAYLVLLIPQES